MIVKSVERKEKSTALLTVEIDREKFEEAIYAAYKKNKSKINVPGFRKGKAPLKIIESMYGKSIFYEDAVDEIAPEAYVFAVEQEKLDTVGRPSIANMDVTEDRVLTLTFKTSLYPEANLKQYKGLEAVKAEVHVTGEDVDEEINRVRSRNSRLVSVEREAKMGDTVTIDFEGFIDGKAFEGGKAEKFNLKLGSESFVPGFEEQIAGMKVGEEKDVNITFPTEYDPSFAGKDAVFKVKLHEVKETVYPELDDEFAKDVSEFDTFEEYKKSVADKLKKEKEEAASAAYKQAILQKLIENLEAEIPDEMVEERLEKMVEEYEARLRSQGIMLEDYLRMVGVGMEDFLKSGMINAENQVRVSVALKKVAELENIEVTEEDIEAEYKRLAEEYKLDIERVKAVIPPEQMKTDLVMIKAEDFVCENGVKLKEAKKEEETAEEEKATEKAEKKAEAPKAKKTTAKRTTKKSTEKKAEKATEE
ncbi:MAG TPA: trigger factor [Clostridiales bacterium]|jgi:trigger factor|nr:trigger factor [Clostridiales bacterium]